MHVCDDHKRHGNKRTIKTIKKGLSQGYTTTLIKLVALSWSIVGHSLCFFGILDTFLETVTAKPLGSLSMALLG